MKASSTFKITEWNEETITELDESGKLTRAHIITSYQGEFEGEGILEYVMIYRSDGSADFIGYESVTGSVKGQPGSFVFEQRGYFKNGIANSTWTIVEGSGTGDLSDIAGKVSFSEGHKEEYSVTLEFMLD